MASIDDDKDLASIAHLVAQSHKVVVDLIIGQVALASIAGTSLLIGVVGYPTLIQPIMLVVVRIGHLLSVA